MKGYTRHFSPRLVELGMTPRQAVECIFLVAAVTGLGGALLSQVGVLGTLVILAQMTGIFLLIVLLMNVLLKPVRKHYCPNPRLLLCCAGWCRHW